MSALSIGSQVMYKTPGMARKLKGTIAGFDSLFDFVVQPVRRGYVLHPQPVVVAVGHVQTMEEHLYRKPALARVGNQLATSVLNDRAATAAVRLGVPESEVLSHPSVLQHALYRVRSLVGSNRIGGPVSIRCGVISHDDADAGDICSAFTMNMLLSLRRQAANAADDLVAEFQSFLAGSVAYCRILHTMLRDGRTAALRFLAGRDRYWSGSVVYDTVAEDDFESGMAAISWEIAMGGAA